jgi:hypothetical protein
LTSIKFANAYRLIGVPFSSIRFLIISLAITYTELLRNNNYQVKLVRVENEAATAGFIGENFKGKTTKDYNDLAPQLDFGSLLRGAVIDFFGLRISLDRQSETLILTASPSSL